MEQVVVNKPDGSTTLLNSLPKVSGIIKAEQSVGLLGEDLVTISVKSATPLEFGLGNTIEVFGKTYTLNQLPEIKKKGVRSFEYDLTFEGSQYELIDVQFLLPDNTIGDSFTGNLKDFLQILLDNILRIFPGKWVLGDYPKDTEFKTLSFAGSNCLEVVRNICEEYNQELEITQIDGVRTLHIRKAGVIFPYTFRYGRTGGLYELIRKNISSKNIVTRLYAYGGSNNLGSKYKYSKLCLPESAGKNNSFIQSDKAIAAYGVKENVKTFNDIFPNRYGEVTMLGSKYYAFIDSTMNFDLNEEDPEGNTKWLIKDVDAKVKFTTGNLAGYEFDVHSYNHATKEIQLVPFVDENGMKFPNEQSAAFRFALGDKYHFIDINLPDQYRIDAEIKLQEKAEDYFTQYSQPQVQYNLSIDQNFIKQFSGELSIVNLFAVGDYIAIEDKDIGVDKSIRVTAFKRDLLQPYKYALTIGDSVAQSTVTRIISDLKNIDETIRINDLADPAKARRNWRTSQEVLANVFDPEGHYYSEKIKPLSIDTTMLSVGAKSMQFILQNTLIEANYEGNKNAVRVKGGSLIHYTIAETTKAWTIATLSATLTDNSKPYYIYGKCEKNGSAGVIIFSTLQIKVDEDPNHYHFWIGVLSSVDEDVRAISLTYGASTINGRFITTGRIESSGGGNTYFDLDLGEIGGRIKFLSNGMPTDLNDWASVIEGAVDDALDVANNAQADATSARAITDNFGTEINGGLISTVVMFLREFNSNKNTAGLSGHQGPLQDMPSFWSGGTYDEAVAFIEFLDAIENEIPPSQFNYKEKYDALAKITLLHNGAAKLGDFIVQESGRIIMIDPNLGIERLVFTNSNLPTIEELTGGANSQGYVITDEGEVYNGGFTTLGVTLVVDKNSSTGYFNGANVYMEGKGNANSSIRAIVRIQKTTGQYRKTLGEYRIPFEWEGDSRSGSTYLPPQTIENLEQGSYIFSVELDHSGDVISSKATIQPFKFEWRHVVQGIKQQRYGANGMMFFYSNNHFYFTENGGADMKGPSNLPGPLAAGSINANGGIINRWGAKLAGNADTITGGYRIFLKDMDHNQYSVQVTPNTATSQFRVGNKTNTYFEIFGSGGADFTVMGDNYQPTL